MLQKANDFFKVSICIKREKNESKLIKKIYNRKTEIICDCSPFVKWI